MAHGVDGDVLGKIVLGVITVVASIYSSWDKRRVRDQIQADAERRSKERQEAQVIVAESLAKLTAITQYTISKKIDEVHACLERNTVITEQVRDIGEKVFQQVEDQIKRDR